MFRASVSAPRSYLPGASLPVNASFSGRGPNRVPSFFFPSVFFGPIPLPDSFARLSGAIELRDELHRPARALRM